jgi:hypothetical protein
MNIPEYLLQPAVRWLRRRGLPMAAAVMLTVAVFFASLGGVAWLIAGQVQATPLTVCLVVLGENGPGLAFLSKLLSDRVHLPVHATLTQRLMADDTIEAADLLARHREQAIAEETYDAVVVPALARVRQAQRLGHLEAASAARIAPAIVNHPGELGAWIAPRAIDVARVLPVGDPGSGSSSDLRPDSGARA